MTQIRAGRRIVPPHLRGKKALERLRRVQREAIGRNDLKTWRRATAALECLAGKNTVQIAEQLKATTSAVSKWLAAYVTRGFEGLHPRSAPGPAPKLTSEQLEELGRIIDDGPYAAGFPSGIWTAFMIADLIRQHFGVVYNGKYVPELLHRIGFSVQRPRKRLAKADHEAQEYWLRVRFPEIKKAPSSRAG